MAHIEDRRWSVDRETNERRRTDYRGPSPWRVRYRAPDGSARSKGFARKTDAEQYLIGVEHSKLTGEYVAPAGGKTLFGDRWQVWYDTTVNLRPSTRARDESYARSAILPTFGRRPLASIDHDAVQRWVAEMTAQGKAPATVAKAHQIMSKVMRSAVKARLIAANPCDDTELPKVERGEQRFLTPEQVSALASAIDPRYRPLVLIGAYGGLRFGELAGLRRGRLDLLRGSVDVVEICTEVRGHQLYGPPKTRAGRRVVPLPRALVDELTTYTAGMAADELVFTVPGGEPLRANNFRRRAWQSACVEVGVGEMVTIEGRRKYVGLRPHDLRHTAVAFWIAAGASPKEIAARAGHASVVTVLDRYGHLLPGTEERVTDALDEMLRGAAAPRPAGEVRGLWTEPGASSSRPARVPGVDGPDSAAL